MTETSKTITTSGKSNSLVFFGTETFSASTLSALIAGGFSIAAVVTKPDAKRGRGQKVIEPLVKTIAKQHNIDVWQPRNLSDIVSHIKQLQPVTGVLVSFGRIIPQAILDLFTPGVINVHPSLLPAYRGPSPIETALLSGDPTTGVTIMKLIAAMDAGPIYAQATYPATITHATQPELYEALGTFGADLLVRNLPAIMRGELTPTEQRHEQASYCQLIAKADGVIDWQQSAAQIERAIRAYKSWPGSRTTLHGIECLITRAHISPEHGTPGDITATPTSLTIATGDASIAIDSLKPIGKKELSVRDFLNGYGQLFLP